MLVAAILFSVWLGAFSQNASVRAPITLPPGVKGVTFGTAHRYYGPGKEMCAIVYPMPGGIFERGVTELTYAVELEAGTVKRASARVVAPAGQELRGVACNIFMPVQGGFSQTQLGSTLSRADKAPLLAGKYTLRITVDGYTAEAPFTIK